MIHPDPLPTITAYCNHCGKVTEQYAMHDGGYACKECLLDPRSRIEWEKDQKRRGHAMTGYICSPRQYTYRGIIIEYSFSGPYPLRKDGEPRMRWTREQAEIISEFDRLPDAERETYRVGGGCREF